MGMFNTHQSPVVVVLSRVSRVLHEHGREGLEHSVVAVTSLSRNKEAELQVSGENIVRDLLVDLEQTILLHSSSFFWRHDLAYLLWNCLFWMPSFFFTETSLLPKFSLTSIHKLATSAKIDLNRKSEKELSPRREKHRSDGNTKRGITKNILFCQACVFGGDYES